MVAAGERVPSSIRLMVVTGEKISVEHYRRWQSVCDHEVLWCNAYGPTEATVSATVFIPDDSFDAPNMPIGKPMKGYKAFILNDQLQELTSGETGQLFIGGPALARGYLNRDDLTQAAFVDVQLGCGTTSQLHRLYRTGDLARWLPNGQIDFAGRIDHQIKLGSYRIEPGEIEAVLDQHASVIESLVSYDRIEGKKFLIAYVATGHRQSASSASAQANAAELANFLRSRLPAYMIPTRYVFVPAFPHTINGKIDRDALPDPATSVVARDSDYVAPRTELESQLATLFQEVLNVTEVGIHDDFFLLGGSSLLVTQVVTRLTTQLDCELPVRDFFANPTVATAAKHVESLVADSQNSRTENVDGDLLDKEDQIAQRERLPLLRANYFQSGGQHLFSVRYQPRSNANGRAVLICPAYGHEYQRSYRNLQQFAVQLCQRGFEVLRFDYAATGNSTGHCQDASIELFRENVKDAAKYFCEQIGPQPLSLVGVRLGATVAASVTANVDLPHLDQVLCWDPIINGSDYLRMLEQFHDRALSSLAYFNRRRYRSAIDQLFGHQMNSTKRASFARLSFPDTFRSPGSSPRKRIIASGGYLHAEPGLQAFAKEHPVLETTDAIQWHDGQFAESAFSSPATYRAMIDCLQS